MSIAENCTPRIAWSGIKYSDGAFAAQTKSKSGILNGSLKYKPYSQTTGQAFCPRIKIWFYNITVTGFVPRLWVMTLWKIFAVDTQFKQLRKRSLKKKNSGFSGIRTRDLCDTGAVLYQLSYEAITVGSRVNFSGSIMPLRVIQHYSEPRFMSNDVMKRSSRLIRNLSNCEREAWKKKKFRLQRDSNPWPLRYRCSALPTELWSHNCWEQVNF